MKIWFDWKMALNILEEPDNELGDEHGLVYLIFMWFFWIVFLYPRLLNCVRIQKKVAK